MSITPREYREKEYLPTWCPGCGDYGVLKAVDMAFQELGLSHEQIVIVAGIGCNGRFPHNFKTYGFHTLHGRVLPVAQGINITKPELHVIGIAGDGDAFAIGGGHFLHAARRNPDITFIVIDNGIYAQTKGQPSPTTPFGFKTDTTPSGHPEDPLDIDHYALSCGISFLGRGFPGRPNHLAHLIAEGIAHKGFSLIHILNPCPTFHDTWSDHIDKIAEIGPEHDPSNYEAALKISRIKEKIMIGTLFKQDRLTIAERARVSTPKLDLGQLLKTYR
jgi:2-oxoglutarate/2-oxoacid ferredoxin oxidoreductase subunit beta